MARFSIGIDLGTTNSALAYAALPGDARAEVLPVPQWETPQALAEMTTLPSFLYLPEQPVAAQLQGRAAPAGTWVVGLLARRRAAETPGRVAQSAKSWLCHHATDREAPFLPWGSDDLPPAQKISPVRASALILNYLRGAWNDRFAEAGADFAFDAQDITVTVPASFDAAAQRLTLRAAEEAGYPAGVRLLEEPQAAFYCWLERHDPAADLWAKLANDEAVDGTRHVLVVDVGGGTSDFSLFEVRRTADAAAPKFRRLAVSEHILLGGDNIDLALGHLLERKLSRGDADTKLGGTAWDHLVARCRDLKERVLSVDGPADETFTIAIPGRGSSLLAHAQSAQLSRDEIDRVLLDGFFPACPADARPKRILAGLSEWGLPYAADTAVTRHLADFLRDRPRCDAVLFNGGSLYPASLRARLVEQIALWQGGAAPLVLDNDAPDLAVARGAARYGKLLRNRMERIEAAAGRAVFVEAAVRGEAAGAGADGRSLVCVLPRGAEPGQVHSVAGLPLSLRINRPVRFQAYSSTRHGRARTGELLPWRAEEFAPLPPLQTVAKLDDESAERCPPSLPVTITATLSELGLVQLAARSAEPGIEGCWPLDFDLRPQQRGRSDDVAGDSAPPAEPNATREALQRAQAQLEAAFNLAAGGKEKTSAARLLQGLEKTLSCGKGEWNAALVRSLWTALEAVAPSRGRSAEHEEAWLMLAGFLLRPGFGMPLDELRIDALWRVRQQGLRFPGKRGRLQQHILWRRLAGGLDRERQEVLLAPEMPRLRQQTRSASAELVRLAGALERLGHDAKSELIGLFIGAAVALAHERQHVAPFLAALGQLLARAPTYAGPDAVVSPDLVERAWEAFADLDWNDRELAELPALFLRAARVVDNRGLDLSKALRSRIATKLEKAGVPALRTARLREYMPMQRAERADLFGEQLPPGFLLGD